MTLLGIEEAVAALTEELDDFHSIEIRGQEKENDRQMGIILVWVDSYEKKKIIYEKYGKGDNLYPALFEGWEIRVKKWPPYVKKKKISKQPENSDVASKSQNQTKIGGSS